MAKTHGFTLIELMISMALGLFLTAAVGHVFGVTVRANSEALVMTRLNQDLRAAMNVMSSDIRRAGYWADAETGINGGAVNPFTQGGNDLSVSAFGTEAANSCITYSYDLDDDGSVDANENLGFRLRNGVAEMATQNANCAANADWEPISDANTVVISNLSFIANLQNIDIDTDGIPDFSIREIVVTVTGRLTADAGVSRTLVESIRIQNDSIS